MAQANDYLRERYGFEDQTMTNAEFVDELRKCAALQKPHFSWPLWFPNWNDEILYEFARLTHGLSFDLRLDDQETIDRAVKACARVNEGAPSIEASIAVNFSPWHAMPNNDPTYDGPEVQEHLDYIDDQVKSFLAKIATANATYSSDVKLTTMLYDSEFYYPEEGNDAHNDALDAKYDSTFDLFIDNVPTGRVEWYVRGSVYRAASDSGWSQSGHFTLREKGHAGAYNFYKPVEIGYAREAFRRTVDRCAAQPNPILEVTPWVALGCGYHRTTYSLNEWRYDWPYSVQYSWQIGGEINHPWYSGTEEHRRSRYSEWDKATHVCFYPAPTSSRVPRWEEHFIAYCYGAHIWKDLPPAIWEPWMDEYVHGANMPIGM